MYKFAGVILKEQSLSEWLLLPPNVIWSDLADPRYAQITHFLPVIPGILIVLVLRYILEKHVFQWLGYSLGIKRKSNKALNECKELENFYSEKSKRKKKLKLSQKDLNTLSKKTELTHHDLQKWFRRRRNRDITPVINKFSESAFRFVFYTTSFVFGMCILWHREWLWDIEKCWTNLPYDHIDDGSHLYYIIQLSYYGSCLVTLPFDNKRKDFLELVIHHLATVLLIGFSYMANFYRAGTLVMVVHDASDIFLELAKNFNYVQFTDLADNVFIAFAIVFFVTRIVVFPLWIINGTFDQAISIYLGLTWKEYLFNPEYPWFPTYFIFNGLLMTLYGLHLFWFSIIVKMAVDMVGKGHIEGDERSDKEEDTEEEQK